MAPRRLSPAHYQRSLNPSVQIFLVLFSLTTPLQGFLIFAAYCINAKVASKWAGLFGTCIPCCKRWEELASSSTSSRF